MKYTIHSTTELIKEPAGHGMPGTGEPGEELRPVHISEVEHKTAMVLTFILLEDNPYHNAIKKAAQYLYQTDRKEAVYITNWQSGKTVWDHKGLSLVIGPEHWPPDEVKELKARYETTGNQRDWQVWPNMPYSAAVQLGKVQSFPPDESGFRLACLASLELENPVVYSFVKSEIVNKHIGNNPLIDRAIRAGFIVHQTGVKKQLNRRGKNQYVVAYVDSLDKAKAQPYVVTKHLEFGCTCEDWLKGTRAHVEEGHTEPPRLAYMPVGFAPHLPGIGVCCEHILAVILKAKIDAYITEETDRIIERMVHPND